MSTDPDSPTIAHLMPIWKPSLLLATTLATLIAACSSPPLLPVPDRAALSRSTPDVAPRLTLTEGDVDSLWLPCRPEDLPPRAARGLSALLPGEHVAFVGQGRARGRYRGTAEYGAKDRRGAVVEADGTLWSRWHQIDAGDAPTSVTRTLARDPEATLLGLFFVQGGGGADRYRAELRPRRAPRTILEIAPDGRVLGLRHRIAAELEFTVPRRR